MGRVVEASCRVEDGAGGGVRIGHVELSARDPVGDDPPQLLHEVLDVLLSHLTRSSGERHVRCEQFRILERLPPLRRDQQLEAPAKPLRRRAPLGRDGLERVDQSRARAIPEGFTILVDTRERYPYRFTRREVEIERVALPAGDYAVAHGEAMAAAVERKTLENFTASLSDGTLAFQMQRLAEVARAAVVVEGRYSALFTLEHVPAPFIADGLARIQVRYPEIPVVFADSRKFAEEWTYRFLAAALTDAMSGT